MMDEKVEISKIQHYLTIITLIVALGSSLITLGYTIRRIDELAIRVNNLEQRGSVTAQMTSKDVQWIMNNLKSMDAKIDRLEDKLDKHMNGR